MSLKDAFIIREARVPAEDWGIDSSAQGMLDAFYEKYSKIETMPNGDRLPLAHFLLFIDDWMGDRDLTNAIEAGDWTEIDLIAKEIMQEYPDPAGFDVAASAGAGSDIPGKEEPAQPQKTWMN